MRTNIIAANWKMNKTLDEGRSLAKAVVAGLSAKPSRATVILAPPFVLLDAVKQVIAGAPNIKLAGQNCHEIVSGAYTGEVSAAMLHSVGAEYVILGHSERREYFGENDTLILEKMRRVLSEGMKAIYCCGEPYTVRENMQQEAYVGKQLDESIMHLSQDEVRQVVIAYEPIWAIGTGQNATPEQIQEMHMFIRWKLERKFGADIAESISILYGGSVKTDNAAAIFSLADVDGGLIGGASLVADDFVSIANSFELVAG